MYKASGSIRGRLPEGERFDAAEVTRRLLAALHAGEALRVKVVDDVITFDGGSVEHRPFTVGSPLASIQDGELRVRGAAPTLAALRAGDVQYRIDWTIRTPLRLVVTLMAAGFVGMFVGLSGGLAIGLRLAMLPLVVGWLSHVVLRFRFRRMLDDAVLRVEKAWRDEVREAREVQRVLPEEFRPPRVPTILTPRELRILGRPDGTPPEGG